MSKLDFLRGLNMDSQIAYIIKCQKRDTSTQTPICVNKLENLLIGNSLFIHLAYSGRYALTFYLTNYNDSG